MRVIVEESDALADLTVDLLQSLDPDCPVFDDSGLPVAVKNQLMHVLEAAVDVATYFTSDDDTKRMVDIIRQDDVVMTLLRQPWKDLYLVDLQGTFALIF
jgi:hypothetical protein